jgi:hypothetical protein
MGHPRGSRKEARLPANVDERNYHHLCELAHQHDIVVFQMVLQAAQNLIRQQLDASANSELPLSRVGADRFAT